MESRGQNNMAVERTKVLIVGESAYKIHVHFKGFASYETGYLSAGLDSFIDRFAKTPVSFDFMHNHDISLRFPFTLTEMQAYDVIVISDAPADSFLLHPQTLAGKIMPDRLAADRRLRARRRGLRDDRRMDVVRRLPRQGAVCLLAARRASPRRDRSERRPHGDARRRPSGAARPEHPILAGLAADWPDMLGYNRFAATRGQTLLTFRETGDPALVVTRSARAEWHASRQTCSRIGGRPFPGLGKLHRLLGQSHALASRPNLAATSGEGVPCSAHITPWPAATGVSSLTRVHRPHARAGSERGRRSRRSSAWDSAVRPAA